MILSHFFCRLLLGLWFHMLHIPALSHITHALLCNFHSFFSRCLQFGCFYWSVCLFINPVFTKSHLLLRDASVSFNLFSPSWILISIKLFSFCVPWFSFCLLYYPQFCLQLCAILWIIYFIFYFSNSPFWCF